MPAGKWNWELRTAETFRRELNWRSRDPATGEETLVDTATAQALMQIRRTANDPRVLLELSSANGMILLGGDPANIILQVDADVTAALSWPEAEQATYDLFIGWEPPLLCLLTGRVTLRHSTTKPYEARIMGGGAFLPALFGKGGST